MASSISSLHLHHLIFFSKPSPSSFPFLRPSRKLPHISCCSSSPSEFNITFAPSEPKPKRQLNFIDTGTGRQVFIPWIICGEDGNLQLPTQPPPRLLHELANANTGKPKKKEKEKKPLSRRATEVSAPASSPAATPPHSKAARRYYNENFRDSAQRLSKVLAAAGVASRRSSEELIFKGKVTVNGSVCNTPQVHEGRNHEVRELVKNAGLQIYALKRIRIGGYRLPTDLAIGKYVELKQGDLKSMGWKG